MQTAKSIDERAGETHKGRTRVPRNENNACAGASVGADSFGRTCDGGHGEMNGKSSDRLVYRTENYRAL